MKTRPKLETGRKRGDLARFLRNAIVHGDLRPGQRVPTREELARQYHVSSNTVQAALSRLTHEGFLHSKRKAGTFVSQTPPHLTTYAFVFNDTPSNDPLEWSRYYATLCNHLLSTQEALSPRQIELHYGVELHADNEAHSMLCHAVREHRVAALLFPNAPVKLEGSPLLDEPGVSRVMVGAPGVSLPIPAVHIDGESFINRAAKRFAQRGLRHAAVLAPSGFPLAGVDGDAGLRDRIARLLIEHGLDSRPQWIQLPEAHKPEAVRAVVQLLFCGADAPEALILADDHYFAPVAAALAGLPEASRPRLLVCYQNFPSPPLHGPVEVQGLGFDSRKVIRGLISLADAQIAGQRVRDLTIASQFDEELT